MRLYKVTEENAESLYDNATDKFVGVSDLTETIVLLLSTAFESHRSTTSENADWSSTLAGLTLNAQFHQGQIDLTTIDEETSINYVYRNGRDSKNPIDQQKWKTMNEVREVQYGRLLRGIALSLATNLRRYSRSMRRRR